MGISSDIENVKVIDKIENALDLAKAMRKAGEFLLKR